jgi:hypothetical protein
MAKITIREYFEAILAERDIRYGERFQAQERELITAKAELDARLGLLNELRGNVLTREEYNAKHETLVAELTVLRDRMNRSEGKGSGYNAAWLIAVAIITILVAIAAVIVVVVVHG